MLYQRRKSTWWIMITHWKRRFEIANENMKQEMNELIIQILYKTGIRKTTTVMINGREFDAVEQTYPDENGIIYFDYSVFEKG